MKRLLLTSLALCMATMGAFAQGSLKKLDERNGFKGIVLGSPIEDYGVEFCANRICNRLCGVKRDGISHNIGTVEISEIRILEYKGRVQSVIADFDYSDWEEVRKVLEAAYGPGKQRTSGDYEWTAGKVALELYSRYNKTEGSLSYYSIELEKQMLDCKKKDAERKAEREKDRIRAAAEADL